MPDINVTTDSAHPHRRIDKPGDGLSDNQPASRIGIVSIHNSTQTPTALRARSTPGTANPVRGKLHTFMHGLWFILKSTTQILQKQYEVHNSLTREEGKAEKPIQATDMDMKAYHIRKKIAALKQPVMRHSGEGFSALHKHIVSRGGAPQINENMATLLFSAKKSINASGTPVLPTALRASQAMGHATERHPLLKKPFSREKRLLTDRRRKDLGPPGKTERRKADRRMQ